MSIMESTIVKSKTISKEALNKIKTWNYGNYSSSNYGSSRAVQIGNLTLYFSYETIIAFNGTEGLRILKNYWSTTTGRHLNAIDNGNKKNRLDQENFNELLWQELQKHNLV